MKSLYASLIFLLISLYKAQEILYCWNMENPVGPKDCNYLPLQRDYYKCCYVREKYYYKGDFENRTACAPLGRYDYDNLAKQVKSKRDYLNAKGAIIQDFVVDCSSNYLYLSLLSFMLFLL